MEPFGLNIRNRSPSPRPRLPTSFVRPWPSALESMAKQLEAKFAQLVEDSKCRTAFNEWLIEQELIDIESFGRAAPTEDLLATEVTAAAKSDGVDFKIIGDKACVAKLWAACRDALASASLAPYGNLLAPRGAAPDPALGMSEGTENTMKGLWLTRHAWLMPDSLLLVRPLQAKLHRELNAVPPVLGVYAMEQLRTMACLETKTATLLQVEPGEAVKGVEIAADTVAGHWQIYMPVRACFYTCAYVSIADPTMFDLQTACYASEKVLQLLQYTYQGRTPPVPFFVLAWTKTCHLFSEALRVRDNPKL